MSDVCRTTATWPRYVNQDMHRCTRDCKSLDQTQFRNTRLSEKFHVQFKSQVKSVNCSVVAAPWKGVGIPVNLWAVLPSTRFSCLSTRNSVSRAVMCLTRTHSFWFQQWMRTLACLRVPGTKQTD